MVVGIQLLVVATIYFFFFFFWKSAKESQRTILLLASFVFFSNLSIFMYLKINSQHLDAIVNLGYFLGEGSLVKPGGHF